MPDPTTQEVPPVVEPVVPPVEEAPKRGDLTVALRQTRDENKALKAELAALRAAPPTPKADAQPPKKTEHAIVTDPDMGLDEDKQRAFAASVRAAAIADATTEVEAKLSLKYEMRKWEVFQSKDRYIQAAAQSALQDKLEQGMELEDAVAEAAREIESRMVVSDKSKETVTGKPPPPAPPIVAPASAVAASVIGDTDKYESKGATPQERGENAKRHFSSFLDKLIPTRR